MGPAWRGPSSAGRRMATVYACHALTTPPVSHIVYTRSVKTKNKGARGRRAGHEEPGTQLGVRWTAVAAGWSARDSCHNNKPGCRHMSDPATSPAAAASCVPADAPEEGLPQRAQLRSRKRLADRQLTGNDPGAANVRACRRRHRPHRPCRFKIMRLVWVPASRVLSPSDRQHLPRTRSPSEGVAPVGMALPACRRCQAAARPVARQQRTSRGAVAQQLRRAPRPAPQRQPQGPAPSLSQATHHTA